MHVRSNFLNRALEIAIILTIWPWMATGAVIAGHSLNCLGKRQLHPAGVDIYVFDGARSPELLSLLKAIKMSDNPDPSDPKSVQDFVAREDRLIRFVKTSQALVRTKTDAAGSFNVDIPGSPESVVVFGYAESVDGPPGYAYAELDPRAGPRGAVILDFTHGHCGH